ncbi:uncharacterized protein LOC130673415 [Microplitis mediator]|uniref:uncharacterized protein LOC130673415 n=1 Tax=Microplitis mediator TaxID=375433 RepID=UPI002553319D|nr:uncharacterized protein LOC130673415 [Microplitis mediator]
MYYLKSTLEGDAARLIANIRVTGDSFASAWDAVVQQYDNNRLLISAQLEKMFSIRPADSNSTKQLKAIINNANEAVQALKALGSPTEQWDRILVHLIVQKLDFSLREAWEVHLGTSTEFPTYEDLHTFLTGRARAREAMECGFSPRKHQSDLRSNKSHNCRISSAQVYVATTHDQSHQHQNQSHQAQPPSYHSPRSQQSQPLKSQSNSSQSHLAASKHTLSFKSDFCLAVHHRLCRNYLGDHSFENCRSKDRCKCKECDEPHHSMLHYSRLMRLTKKPPAVKDEASTSSPPPVAAFISSAISRASDHKAVSSRPTVLLATAQALISHSSGSSHRIRVLIDPGSELTLISQAAVRTCSLIAQSCRVLPQGVGNVSSGKTEGIILFILRSSISSEQAPLNAYILKKITAKIPSVSISPTLWSHIQDLELAEPEFHKSGKIDLLIGADFYGQIIRPGLRSGSSSEPIAMKTMLG